MRPTPQDRGCADPRRTPSAVSLPFRALPELKEPLDHRDRGYAVDLLKRVSAVRICPGAQGMTRIDTRSHPAHKELIGGTRTTRGPLPRLVQSTHCVPVRASGGMDIAVGGLQRFVPSPALYSRNFDSLPYPLSDGRMP